jgi:hypothetical protein
MTSQASPRELMRIQRKLDSWELIHLRDHALALHLQLEAAQAEIERLKDELAWSDGRADMFHDLASELAGMTEAHIALNRSGALRVMNIYRT